MSGLDKITLDDAIRLIEAATRWHAAAARSACCSCSTEPAPEEASHKERGTVKWYNDAKGFGMIAHDGGGPDVFVCFSEIQMEGYRTLTEGDRVEFAIGRGQKGPRAYGVIRIEEEECDEPQAQEGEVAFKAGYEAGYAAGLRDGEK